MTQIFNDDRPTETLAYAPPPRTFEVVDDLLTLGDVEISFQRTLRVSERGVNALPPSLGSFPLRVLDPGRHRVSAQMTQRGGVLMPMYTREAMWLCFGSSQPVAVQIGTGGRCVISGRPLERHLRRRPQNYVVLPHQPWLDGYKTGEGEVRQFVGVGAGSRLSAEAQLTGGDAVGGIQIQVWHLTPEAWARWVTVQSSPRLDVCYSMEPPMSDSMAIGLGGRIQQEIYPDEFSARDWQTTPTARVWVHPVSAASWLSITGEVPPPTPVDSSSYIRAGLPWFDYYDADRGDLPTAPELAGLKSIGTLLNEDDNTPTVSVEGAGIVRYGDRRSQPVQPGDWKWA